MLKILSRKRCNRLAITPDTTKAIIGHLSAPLCKRTAAEAANVMLNVCYEQQNVDIVVKQGAPATLIPLLRDASLDVQANVAGALQSICYQKPGRAAIRTTDAVESLTGLLGCDSPKVVTRAVGALHNISSDTQAIRAIRRFVPLIGIRSKADELSVEAIRALCCDKRMCMCSRCNGIPKLVKLLKDPSLVIAASAAGALQNVSREVASRMIIWDTNCTPALANLISTGEAHAQVCAAGALLNILGPHVSRKGDTQRHGMCKLLSTTMALATAYAGCFDGATLPAATV